MFPKDLWPALSHRLPFEYISWLTVRAYLAHRFSFHNRLLDVGSNSTVYTLVDGCGTCNKHYSYTLNFQSL